MYRHRGVYGIRSLQGLLHLAKQHPVHALEGAAAQALERACFRLRDLRTLVYSVEYGTTQTAAAPQIIVPQTNLSAGGDPAVVAHVLTEVS